MRLRPGAGFREDQTAGRRLLQDDTPLPVCESAWQRSILAYCLTVCERSLPSQPRRRLHGRTCHHGGLCGVSLALAPGLMPEG